STRESSGEPSRRALVSTMRRWPFLAVKLQVSAAPRAARRPLAVPGTGTDAAPGPTSGNSPTTSDGTPSGVLNGDAAGTGSFDPGTASAGAVTRTTWSLR